MKLRQMSFLTSCLLFIFLCGAQAFAQSGAGVWLDQQPLPSWNSRKRAILETKKVSGAELRRCAAVVRQPTLAQDFLLTKMNWTLTGAAHVFGRTAIVTVAEAFDGQCRPLKYETYVFVGNRVAGTLTPGPLDSRADGALVNVQLGGEKNLIAQFARYRQSDSLCCPSKTETVSYVIKPDGANFLLVPESKTESRGN